MRPITMIPRFHVPRYVMPPTADIDAVFGSGTRLAILSWQLAKGRQSTGLLGNDDAAALLQDTVPSSSAVPSSPSVTPQASIPPTSTAIVQNPAPAPPVLAPGLSPEQTGSGDEDWRALVSQAAAQGLTVVYQNSSSSCSVTATMDDGTMEKLADQYITAAATDTAQQQSWRGHNSPSECSS
jgi:hypothetical protein